MSNVHLVSDKDYFIKNETLYLTSKPEDLQDSESKAHQLATDLIRENREALQEIEHERSQSIVLIDPLRDPFFWLYITHPHSCHSHGGGGCGGGGCGGSGGNGEGIIIVALIATLFSTIVAAGFTLAQGYDAYKADQAVRDAKKEAEKTKDPATKKIFQKIGAIQEEEWRDRTIIALSTATITVGLICLVASLSLLLYAKMHQQIPSSLVSRLAIGGAAVIGLGTAAHIIRPSVKFARKTKILNMYKELASAIQEAQYIPNSLNILKECPDENAYIYLDSIYYIKTGKDFKTSSSKPRGYTEIKVMNKTEAN